MLKRKRGLPCASQTPARCDCAQGVAAKAVVGVRVGVGAGLFVHARQRGAVATALRGRGGEAAEEDEPRRHRLIANRAVANRAVADCGVGVMPRTTGVPR